MPESMEQLKSSIRGEVIEATRPFVRDGAKSLQRNDRQTPARDCALR